MRNVRVTEEELRETTTPPVTHSRKTYVSFQFSAAFLDYHGDDEFCENYPRGTIDALKNQFVEVEVANRYLSSLTVPAGTFRFYFYDRLVAVVEEDGMSVEMRSDEMNCSSWYYYGGEGILLVRGQSFPTDPKADTYLDDSRTFHWGHTRKVQYERLHERKREWRRLLKTYRTDRLFVTPFGWQGGCEAYVALSPEDVYLAEGEVTVVDFLKEKRRREWVARFGQP